MTTRAYDGVCSSGKAYPNLGYQGDREVCVSHARLSMPWLRFPRPLRDWRQYPPLGRHLSSQF
jgi:hypothetical protein